MFLPDLCGILTLYKSVFLKYLVPFSRPISGKTNSRPTRFPLRKVCCMHLILVLIGQRNLTKPLTCDIRFPAFDSRYPRVVIGQLLLSSVPVLIGLSSYLGFATASEYYIK